MPANTSAASLNCGTHLGLTKLVTSMLRSPVADSRSISAILSAVAIIDDSLCNTPPAARQRPPQVGAPAAGGTAFMPVHRHRPQPQAALAVVHQQVAA